MVNFGLNSAMILAQVNFGLNSTSILGIFFAVGGASLYFIRSVRPELSRDHDIFFAAIGLLYGFILLFQGWRLDPILQFSQFLLAGSTIFFAVEAVRLRGIATEQARRKSPIVDEDRAVSRVYRNAELDELEPYDSPNNEYEESPRRLRGYSEPGSRRAKGYDDDSEPRSRKSRTPSNKYRGDEQPPTSRKRRPRPSNSRSSRSYDRFDESRDAWDDERPSPSSSSSTGTGRPRPKSRPRPKKNRRPRYRDEADRYSSADNDVITTDYVDYNPEEEQESNGGDRTRDMEERDPRSRARDQGGGDRSRDREQGRGDRSNPINFDY